MARTDDGTLDAALGLGFRLVDSVDELAVGLAELGDIELPSVTGSAADQAHLRTAAPLYLAAELETAQLVPAAETLAGILVSGGLDADIGDATPELLGFWQRRHERFTAAERRAFFARLFGDVSGPSLGTGGASNTAFDGVFTDLAEALYRLGGGQVFTDHAVRAAAGAVAANLLPRSGGMAAFAARDLLTTIRDALRIFGLPAVQRSLGTRSVWGAVARVAERYLRTTPDIAGHVARGKSGQLVLAWLAEVLLRLDVPGERIAAPGDPVAEAATAWLQASLALHERATAGRAG